MSPKHRSIALLLPLLFAAVPLGAQQVRAARPGGALGPTPVTVAFLLVDLLEIDDVGESFQADFVLQARWRDDRLAWDPAEMGAVRSLTWDLDEVWHPGLAIVNQRDLRRQLPEHVRVAPDGSVIYVQRFLGRLSTTLELRSFPSDRQGLGVQVVTVGNSPREVSLDVDHELTAVLAEASLAGWSIELGDSAVGALSLVPSHQLAAVTFHIEAQREVGYFLWTVMLPLALIVFMAYTVFWIDPNFLPSQVGVSTAAFFSMIAYRTALRLALPRVSYMTKADVFILGSTLLVFGALAHAIATGRLAKTGREERANAMKTWGRRVYPVLFVLIVLSALVW